MKIQNISPNKNMIGPKWTSKLLWWAVYLSVIYLVTCFFLIVSSYFSKNDMHSFWGFIGLVLYIPFSFVFAALGFIVYGIGSIISKVSYVKMGNAQSYQVTGTDAIIAGFKAILIGILFLSMIASASYAMVCSSDEPSIICSILWFFQFPFEVLGKIVTKLHIN